MSSNSAVLFAACAALALTGCAKDNLAGPDPVTPTQRFAIGVASAPRELRLGVHRDGLSANQDRALAAFVQDWGGAEGGVITIAAPSTGVDPAAAYRTAADARDFLIGHGAPTAKVAIVGYEGPAGAPPPVVIAYKAYVATGPRCGQEWEDLTRTANNREYAQFGCAITANMAAQIADPADLVAPQAMAPPDAARRQVVLDKYRQGSTTSSAKDPQANGAVSTAIQ